MFAAIALLLFLIWGITSLVSCGSGDTAPEPTPTPEPTAEVLEEEDTTILIALDAGHGGTDVGAIGFIQESLHTQSLVDEIEALFALDDRFSTVLSHEADTFANPSTRVATVNATDADLLISLHCNSDSSSDSYGFECYAVPPGYENHEDSVALAEYLVAEFEPLGYRIRGWNGVRYAYYDDDGNKTIIESSDDDIYEDGTFTLLESLNCPAVLIEQFFVTSFDDVNNYATDEAIDDAALACYTAICNYFALTPLSF